MSYLHEKDKEELIKRLEWAIKLLHRVERTCKLSSVNDPSVSMRVFYFTEQNPINDIKPDDE